MQRVLVTGAGGFIGGHLVRRLRDEGVAHVRAVDVKPLDEWYQRVRRRRERRRRPAGLRGVPRRAAEGADDVFNLAADMGGMGFIENNKAAVHAVGADQHAHADGGPRGAGRALLLLVVGLRLRRGQAGRAPRSRPSARRTPIRPCRRTATAGRSSSASGCAGTSRRTSASQTRVARYHNVYGPHGTWDGGREKAPAAICRKVDRGQARPATDEIEIWGDGAADPQLHVHRRLRRGHAAAHGQRRRASRSTSGPASWSPSTSSSTSSRTSPGVKLERQLRLDAPQGVRGRNSDNTLSSPRLGWEPDHVAAGRAWPTPTRGSTTRWRPASCDRDVGPRPRPG